MRPYYLAFLFLAATLFAPAARAQMEIDSYLTYVPNGNSWTLYGYSYTAWPYGAGPLPIEVDAWLEGNGASASGSDGPRIDFMVEVDLSAYVSQPGDYYIDGLHYYWDDSWAYQYEIGETYYDVDVEPVPAISNVTGGCTDSPNDTSCDNPWQQGATAYYTISGSGFGSCPQVSVSESDGTWVSSYSDSTITGTVTVDSSATSLGFTVSPGTCGQGFYGGGGPPTSNEYDLSTTAANPAPAPTLTVTSGSTPVASGSTVRISDTPSLSLVASLVPSQGTTLTGNVSWQFSSVTTGYGPYDWTCSVQATLSATSPWNVGSTSGLCGGTASITYTYGGTSQSLTFQIKGTNPGVGAVNNYIGSDPWFLRQLVENESSYQQFTSSGDPNFTPADGFGLMQIDPPDNTFQIWDWTANAQAGISRLNAFNATSYWNNTVSQWQAFNVANPQYAVPPPSDTSEGPCIFSYSPAGGAHPFSDATWIKRYNVGYQNPYIQFTSGTDALGRPVGTWIINPINNDGVPYVARVCSAVAPQ